jgi:hypothetical protein
MTNASTAPLIEPLIDASLTRLFTVRMRLGQFDPPSTQPEGWATLSLTDVDTPAHRALAMDAALQGFVLLKNNQGTLPLRAGINPANNVNAGTTNVNTAALKIAVLGPNSNSAEWMLGNYHERAVPGGVLLSPCDGLKAVASGSVPIDGSGSVGGTGDDEGVDGIVDTTVSAISCPTPSNCSIGGNASVSTCFDGASKAAIDAADVVVLFVGVDGSQEAEGLDKTSLLLPGTQLEMVDAVTAAAAAANDTPVVVVVMGGSPVDLSTVATHPTVKSILWVGYPGQASGAAIAHALFGTTNKFGKLPMTW